MKKLIAMGLTVIMTAVAVCGCGSSDSVMTQRRATTRQNSRPLR